MIHCKQVRVFIMKIKDLKIIPHRKISECPFCGSLKVGEYFKGTGYYDDYVIYSHLKKGEYFIPTAYIDGCNCCCLECSSSWPGYIENIFISYNELTQIKKEKGILPTDIDYYKKYQDIKKKEHIENKKQKRKEKRKQRKEARKRKRKEKLSL